MEYLIAYRSMKQGVIDQLAITDATAHMHMGLMIYVFVAMIMRKRLHSSMAIGAVLFCAVLNEIVDWSAGGLRSNNSFADIVNTILWPLAIFALARLRHQRVLGVSRRHQEMKRKLLDLEPRVAMPALTRRRPLPKRVGGEAWLQDARTAPFSAVDAAKEGFVGG